MLQQRLHPNRISTVLCKVFEQDYFFGILTKQIELLKNILFIQFNSKTFNLNFYFKLLTQTNILYSKIYCTKK